MVNIIWLVLSIPLKNMLVSWDDDIPNIWKNKIHVPNHQPVIIFMEHIMEMIKEIWGQGQMFG
jgi:hypothetical protein